MEDYRDDGDEKGLEHFEQVKPKSYQFKALMRKNIKLQLRQRCTLACQILVPLLLILFLGAMQLMFNILVKGQAGGNKDPDVKSFLDFSPSYTDFFLGADPNNLPELGYLYNNGSKGGFLGLIEQYVVKNTTLYVPFVDRFSTRQAMMKRLVKYKEDLLAAVQSGQKYDFTPFPGLSFTFNNISLLSANATNRRLNVEVLREEQFPYFGVYDGKSPTDYYVGGVNEMSGLLVEASTLHNPNHTVKLQGKQRGFPYKQSELQIDIGSLMASLAYPLILSWLLPVYVYNIVLEKQEKLREMMKMMGLKMMNYWLVTYLYYAVLYIMVLIVVYSLSYAFSFAIFTQGSVIATLVSFLLWGNAQIALSFFFSAIFNRTRVATIFTYFLVIIQVVVSYVVNVVVFQMRSAPFFWLLYPPFAFYRIVYLLGILCGIDLCPQTSDYDWSNEITRIWVFLFFTSIFFFALGSYLDNVLPKEFGLSKSPWYFLEPIGRLLRKCFYSATGRKRQRSSSTGPSGKPPKLGLAVDDDDVDDDYDEEKMLLPDKPLELSFNPLEGATQVEEEPFDVARERQKVYNAQIPADCPVVIVDLRKEYSARFGKSKKVALKNLTLSIQKGECFGLLGPNGAGKTTTISILTGLFPPSSGYARIGGFDIRTQIDYVHRVMGVCPQFDTLWMDLTCEETLLFYARLKGISRKEEDAHVRQSLEQVSLHEYRTRLVKDLSGGMRRRLSVAVALVGNPRIVFLDEPTTGLDPENRRQLWDVLTNVKAGRCMILTTHSMEEADILCTTIGIMSKGMLRCVGPQQDLKRRFGQGYTMKVNFDPHKSSVPGEVAGQVDEFVRANFPEAKLLEDFPASRTYKIPSHNLKISELFDVMQERAVEAGITDWGINQTSLEDVFLNIVRNDEADAETSTNS